MDIRKLQRAIVDGLEDVKAQNIAVFNTEHLSALFERVIIASGTSNRQTKALASSVRDSVKSQGMQVLATEGEDNGEWIIVDCGAAVAHIMQPAIRDYYHLEEIWGGKNVRLKLGAAAGGLVKASEPVSAPRKSAARKSVAVKQTVAAAPPPARKAPAKKAPVKKAVARNPVARKSAAKKVAKKAAVRAR
jgi:ribosome-associated protein